MKFGKAFLQRFGLFSRKSGDARDLFDQRLERSKAREDRREARKVLFRNRQLPQEA